MNVLVERSEAGLKSYESIVEAISPEAQLRRGFALIHRESDSSYIKREHEVKPDDQIVIEFQDGRKRAVIRP